jgi:hypothetical protein
MHRPKKNESGYLNRLAARRVRLCSSGYSPDSTCQRMTQPEAG